MVALPEQFPQRRVLIVEDVLPLSIEYRAAVRRLGAEPMVVASVDEARRALPKGPWHAALVDLNLPDGSGFEVMQGLRKRWPHCGIVVVTGEDSIDNAVRAAHSGAMDFVEKPVDAERLAIVLRNALQAASLSQQVQELAPAARGEFHSFIGASPGMQAVYRMIETIGPSSAPVFIHGESGTGKELAAEALHASSLRADGPMVPINCAAIPKDLIESELLGHVRGAFTGAVSDRNGAFLQADGGTLFLDEIAELDLQVQAKLLRVLQTGEVRRLGDTKSRQVDVRIVCASHRDLRAQVRAGRFREDLFYRLYVIPLELPPLRERGDDVLAIAEHMLQRFAKEDGKSFKRIAKAAEAKLREHPWPGNVRELINAIRAAVVLHDAAELQASMLALGDGTPAPQDFSDAMAAPAVRAPVSGNRQPGAAPGSAVRPLAAVERDAIEHAVQVFGGSIPKAARALGVNPSTLYRKMAAWE